MKAYVMTSGAIFGLITIAHVWRVFDEGARLVTEPWYVLMTLAAAALSLWAWRLVRVARIQTPAAEPAHTADGPEGSRALPGRSVP